MCDLRPGRYIIDNLGTEMGAADFIGASLSSWRCACMAAPSPAQFEEIQRMRAWEPGDCLKWLGGMRRQPPGGARTGQAGRQRVGERGPASESARARGSSTHSGFERGGGRAVCQRWGGTQTHRRGLANISQEAICLGIQLRVG